MLPYILPTDHLNDCSNTKRKRSKKSDSSSILKFLKTSPTSSAGSSTSLAPTVTRPENRAFDSDLDVTDDDGK